MYIARFKTAYQQREIILDAKLTVDSAAVGSNAATYKDLDGNDILGLPVGTIVAHDAATNVLTEVKATVVGGKVTVAPAVTLGDYIIAQSDATMSNGHVPVETLSYKYINKCDYVGASSVKKPIALFRINDVSDIVVGVK